MDQLTVGTLCFDPDAGPWLVLQARTWSVADLTVHANEYGEAKTGGVVL